MKKMQIKLRWSVWPKCVDMLLSLLPQILRHRTPPKWPGLCLHDSQRQMLVSIHFPLLLVAKEMTEHLTVIQSWQPRHNIWAHMNKIPKCTEFMSLNKKKCGTTCRLLSPDYLALACQDACCLSGRTDASKVKEHNTWETKHWRGPQMLLTAWKYSEISLMDARFLLWVSSWTCRRPVIDSDGKNTSYSKALVYESITGCFSIASIQQHFHRLHGFLCKWKVLCTFICPGVVRCILYKVSPLMDLLQTWITRENINRHHCGMIYSQLSLYYTQSN